MYLVAFDGFKGGDGTMKFILSSAVLVLRFNPHFVRIILYDTRVSKGVPPALP